MDLFIKTLTGTVFELRVNPFETVLSIKAKLQNLEGIPISQQHLVWHAEELEDDFCLFDYNIPNGSSLQLVLAMRGGPINMRRVSIEEPFFKEMEEVIDSTKDEVWNQMINDDHQFTLLVFRDGEKLNFFRVYDNSDGSNSSHNESLSTTSLCNNVDGEDGDDSSTYMAKQVENVVTKDKMQVLRRKIELCKKSKMPTKTLLAHPPINARVNGPSKHQSFNLPPCRVIPKRQDKSSSHSTSSELKFSSDKPCNGMSKACVVKRQPLPPVQSKDKHIHNSDTNFTDKFKIDSSKVNAQRSYNHGRTLSENGSSSSFRKYTQLPNLHEISELHRDVSCERLASSESSRHGRVLKSLGTMNKSEAGDFLYGLNKSSHNSNTALTEQFFTEDTVDLADNESYKALVRWMQPQIKESKKYPPGASNNIQKYSPKNQVGSLPRLPSLNENVCPSSLTGKKRLRCTVCSKKLGLATTYECRCSQKFCSVHRYPETHTCSYDYKLEGRKLLEKSNPIVVAPKLPKI